MKRKLQETTTLSINHDDLAAILTEVFCGDSYGAFSDLTVTLVEQGGDGAFHMMLQFVESDLQPGEAK